MNSLLQRAKSVTHSLYLNRAVVYNPVAAAWFFARSGPPERSALFRFRQVCLPGLLKFKARKKDWLGVREVLLRREYKEALWELQYTKAPVVLDLGANIGTFAIFVLAHFPVSRVLSLEPAADTYAMLEGNRAMNQRLYWQCVHGALWAEAGTLRLQHSKASTGNQVTFEGGDEEVPAITLPEVIDRVGGRVDLAKMDIEGAEEGVLGAAAASLAAIASLVIEIHNDRIDERRVADVLRRRYAFCYLIPGRGSRKPLVLATDRTRSLPAYKCP